MPANKPGTSDNTQPKSPNRDVEVAKNNNFAAQDVSSIPKSPNTVEKILADDKIVSQEEANMSKLSNLKVPSPTENKIVEQYVTNMPKSPISREKSPTRTRTTENRIVKQDEAQMPLAQHLREKSPTKTRTVRQDVANMQKSPNMRLKTPTDNQFVGRDVIRKPKSPNLTVKTPTVNRTVRQDVANMPKSPNRRLKIPMDNKHGRQDEVGKPRSPNLTVKIPRENINVTHDGVSLPRSPKSPAKIPPAMKSVVLNVSASDPPENDKEAAEVDPDPWTFKKVCVTFAMGTSNHGFANANRLWVAGYNKCSIALLVTALFMPLTGFLLGFIGVRDMLQPNYFSTQITLINDIENGLALPKIILSNSGLFNYSALQEYNVSRYEASLITTLLLGDVAYTNTLDNNIEKANKDYHALLTRLNTTALDVWTLLSYSCHEVIISCQFNDKRIPGTACCKEHFETVMGDFGVSFVSKTQFVQEREEIPSGLSLNLRVPIHPLDLDWEYMRGDAILLKSGLRVSVLDSNKDYSSGFSSTTPVLGNDRILVSLSYDQHDNTGLYQSLFPWFEKAPDCTTEDAPVRELVAVGDRCMSNSRQVCGQKLRNCNIVSFPFITEGKRFCDFQDHVAMVHSRAVAECRADHVATCGNLCQQNVYGFSVQTCPLLKSYDTPDKGNNSKWSVEGGFTMFYTHLSHNLIAKSKTNFVNVLCTLGGTMNMFMGASVLNLGEETTVIAGMIIYTFVAIRRKIAAYRQRKAGVDF